MKTQSLFRYGLLNNVELTPVDYEKLVTVMGKGPAERYIEKLSAYLPNRRKKPYKSHMAVILSWALNDGLFEREKRGGPLPSFLGPDLEQEVMEARVLQTNRFAAQFEADKRAHRPTEKCRMWPAGCRFCKS